MDLLAHAPASAAKGSVAIPQFDRHTSEPLAVRAFTLANAEAARIDLHIECAEIPGTGAQKKQPGRTRTLNPASNLNENCKHCMNRFHEIFDHTTTQRQKPKGQAGLDPVRAQPDTSTDPVAKLSPRCTAMRQVCANHLSVPVAADCGLVPHHDSR